MKKLLLVGVMVGLVLAALPTTASALIFSPDQSQMSSFYKTYGTYSWPYVYIIDNSPIGDKSVGIAVNLVKPGTPNTSWRSIMIGANYWGYEYDNGLGYPTIGSLSMGDLSDYSAYRLAVTNTDDDTWLFNTYMNTGWTDPSWNETDRFYQGSWIELAYGQSAILEIDFASADTYINGTNMGMNSIQNLNHVSNIGLMIGGRKNDATDAILFSQVPEPSSMLMLGTGLIGLIGGAFRKKFVA